jgi:hypothetical protein
MLPTASEYSSLQKQIHFNTGTRGIMGSRFHWNDKPEKRSQSPQLGVTTIPSRYLFPF